MVRCIALEHKTIRTSKAFFSHLHHFQRPWADRYGVLTGPKYVMSERLCCIRSSRFDHTMSHRFPRVGGDGTKIVPVGDIFDQPPGEMSSIRGKLAELVRDHVDFSPEGAVLVTSSRTEPSYPLLPQSLNGTIIIKISEGKGGS